MKGLIRNNFYTLQENMMLSFITGGILMLFSFYTGSAMMLIGVTALQILLFVMNVGTVLQSDEKSGWNKIEMTLPVTEGQIVTAKYAMFLILIFTGVLLGMVTVFFTYLRGTVPGTMLFRGIWIGLENAFMISAVMYPLVLKFGSQKSEFILVIATIISFAVWGILHLLLSVIGNSFTANICLTILAAAMFAVSAAVSLKIQAEKEFP